MRIVAPHFIIIYAVYEDSGKDIMNIALLRWEPFNMVSGSRIYISNLAKSLTLDGHNTYIFTRGEICPFYESTNLRFLTIDYHKYSDRHFIDYLKFCNKLAKELKIDVIHSHYPHAFFIANILKQTIGIPYFITLHGYEYKYIIDIKTIQLTKQALDNANNIFSASSEVIENIKEKVNIDIDDRYIYMPNAVNQINFHTIQKKNNKQKILFVGRLAKEKGLEFLFKAMLFFRNRSDIELHIIGSGFLQNWCENFINDNKMENIIKMCGQMDHIDVIKKMCDSSIMIIPSIYESMPTVLLEAMVVGKPIIVTNVYGVNNAIENMKDGIIIEQANTTEIVKNIELLLADQQLCEFLGKNAKEKALNNFLWSHISKKIFSYYKNSLIL